MIQTAQEMVWKNELAMDYNEKFGEGNDQITKRKSCEEAIKKDLAYIEFLKGCLQ